MCQCILHSNAGMGILSPYSVFYTCVGIRGKTTRGYRGEAPPNVEKLVICWAIVLAAGIIVGQF